MGISTKYFFFNREQKSGLRGKPVSTAISNSFIAYSDCIGSSPTVVYTSSTVTVLDIGVTVYSDAALTTPQSSFYSSPSYSAEYVTNGSGVITAINFCYLEWAGNTLCNGAGSPIHAYTLFSDTVLGVGIDLYADNTLTLGYGGSIFVYDGNIYGVTAGTINSVQTCLQSFAAYTDCSETTPVTYYTENVATITINTRIYTDASRNNEFSGSFAYNGSTYNVNSGTGVTSIISCST